MTSSFQQMKELLAAVKACQTEAEHNKERLAQSHSECGNNGSQQLQENNEAINQSGEGQGQAKDGDSDEDAIFYDAYDAMILDEIEKEYKKDSRFSLSEEYKEQEIRTTLPALKPDGKFSLLKVLKDAVGKDLTKF